MFKNLLRKAFGRSNLQYHESFGFQVQDDNGRIITPNGYDSDGYVWTPNRVVDQGLNYTLNAALRGEGVISSWFVAPFAANTTPAANVTAANFASTLTEFTNYDEPNRVAWVTDGSATTLTLVNDAAPSLFTIGSGGQTTIFGGGLLSAQAKSATTGTCFAAGRLQGGGSITGLQPGYEVRIKYRVTASSS